MRNILDKVSPAAKEKIKRRVQDVFYAPSLETAKVLRDYYKEHPATMRSFNDDLEACLVYLRRPLGDQKAMGEPIYWSAPSRSVGDAPRLCHTSSRRRRV